MAVLVEAISVIIRTDALLAAYKGDWDAFKRTVPNETLCADGELVRIGFMSPEDVEAYVGRLREAGLTYLTDGVAQDLVVVDRSLLLLLLSLLIRSPANRFRYENYPARFGLLPSDDIGKVNMHQQFRIAKELCESGHLSNQYFVLIHSLRNEFVFGDGILDWLTPSLIGLSISGRTLVTLTPDLCVYLCTPNVMRPTPNCASLGAAPWMVDRINDIVQIYACDMLFFLGRPPVLTDVFRQRKFQEHARKTDKFIDMLDEVAGNRSAGGISSRGTFEVASRRRN